LSDEETRTKIYKLAEFAVQQINQQSNGLYRQNLIRVVKAEKQVVAGVAYYITLTNGQSSCRNTPDNLDATADSCPLSNDETAIYQQCDAKVWVKAWLNFQKLSEFSCSSVDATTAKGA